MTGLRYRRWFGLAFMLTTAGVVSACGEGVTDPRGDDPGAAGSPRALALSLTHHPTDPNAGESVTISVNASGGSVTSLHVLLNDQVVASCTEAPCQYVGALSAGEHRYSAVATDSARRTVSSGLQPFTVWLAELDRSSAPTSPHWQHMRTSIIDYRIHYQKEPQRSAEYDWAAGRYDQVIGGPGLLSEYKKRNPTIRHLTYDKFWFTPAAEAWAMEDWLRAHGYDVESAYLHTAGALKDSANRVTAQQYAGRDYWYLNLGDAGYRAWRAYRGQQVLAANTDGYQSESFFFDTSSNTTVKKYIPAVTLEYASHSDYFRDFHAVLADHRAQVPTKFVVLNQAQYFTKPDDIATANVAGGIMTEYGNTPFGNTRWAEVDALVANGVTVQFATGVSPGSKGDQRRDITPGNYETIRDRVLMWEYGSYLMVVDPNRMDAVLFETYGLNWGEPFSVTWLPAFEVNIGLALNPRTQVQSGIDGAGQKYSVFMRQFQNNALVVMRPQGGTDYGDHTAVKVPLPAGRSWHMLRGDASRGNPVTTVELRNSEAVILIASQH